LRKCAKSIVIYLEVQYNYHVYNYITGGYHYEFFCN
jgi:hypothetical protein